LQLLCLIVYLILLQSNSLLERKGSRQTTKTMSTRGHVPETFWGCYCVQRHSLLCFFFAFRHLHCLRNQLASPFSTKSFAFRHFQFHSFQIIWACLSLFVTVFDTCIRPLWKKNWQKKIEITSIFLIHQTFFAVTNQNSITCVAKLWTLVKEILEHTYWYIHTDRKVSGRLLFIAIQLWFLRGQINYLKVIEDSPILLYAYHTSNVPIGTFKSTSPFQPSRLSIHAHVCV